MASQPAEIAQRGFETYSKMPYEMQMSDEKRTLFYQNNMTSESGFHSGATTPAEFSQPDVNVEQNFYVTNQPGFRQEFYNQADYQQNNVSHMVQTQAPSAAFAADSYENPVQMPNFPSIADDHTASIPTVNVESSYQDGNVQVEQVLQDLNKLLKDSNQVDLIKAIQMVQQFTRKKNLCPAIMSSPSITSSLVQALRSNNVAITNYAAEVLYEFSNKPTGLTSIYKCGGIPAFINLLGYSYGSVLKYSVTVLHNLLCNQDGAVAAVRNSGGLQRLVALLRSNNGMQANIVKFLTIVIDCLHILAFKNQESKMFILKSGAAVALVEIVRSYQYEPLLFTAARVLKVLSVCSMTKQVIVAAGCVQALGMHLTSRSQRLVLQCLWTLRNLSDAATEQENVGGLIKSLIHLLRSGHTDVITCSVGILSNLTHNPFNKDIVFQMRGVPALVESICNAKMNDAITEPAVCALRHLTNGHPTAIMAQREIVAHSALNVIIELLGILGKWHVKKAVVGLIRNLLMEKDNHIVLSNLGVVKQMVQLLVRAHQQATQIEKDPKLSASINGVKMVDIMKITLIALRTLVYQHNTQTVLKKLNITAFLQKLQQSDIESIQSSASHILKVLCGTEIPIETEKRSSCMGPSSKPFATTSAHWHTDKNHTQEYRMQKPGEANPFFKVPVTRGPDELEAHLQALNSEYDNFSAPGKNICREQDFVTYPDSSRGTSVSSMSACMTQEYQQDAMDTLAFFDDNYNTQTSVMDHNLSGRQSAENNYRNKMYSDGSCSGSAEYYRSHEVDFSASIPSPNMDFLPEDVFHSESANPSCSNSNSFYGNATGSTVTGMPMQEKMYPNQGFQQNTSCSYGSPFHSNSMPDKYPSQVNRQNHMSSNYPLHIQNPNTPQGSEPQTPVDWQEVFDPNSDFSQELLNDIDMDVSSEFLDAIQSFYKLE